MTTEAENTQMTYLDKVQPEKFGHREVMAKRQAAEKDT